MTPSPDDEFMEEALSSVLVSHGPVVRQPVPVRTNFSYYDINVRERHGIFVLHNGDNICGPRLVRDPDSFPLTATDVYVEPEDVDWVRYRDEESAKIAAAKLQKYLDKWEAHRKKGK